MQSSTGQYSTHAGDPAQPVQHSVMTANSLGFFFRGVASPLDLGSNFSSSGTIPTALVVPAAAGMSGIIPKKHQRRRPFSAAWHSPDQRPTGGRAPHVPRVHTAISSTPPGACGPVFRTPRTLGASFPASAGRLRPPSHPNCDSPCEPDRTLCVPVPPARAVHDRPAGGPIASAPSGAIRAADKNIDAKHWFLRRILFLQSCKILATYGCFLRRSGWNLISSGFGVPSSRSMYEEKMAPVIQRSLWLRLPGCFNALLLDRQDFLLT